VKALLAAAVAAALMVAASPAPATGATPTQRLAKLERQVRTLQRQNRTLTRQLREANEGVTAAIFFSVCSTAITADALQSTWGVIDQISQPTLSRTFFGAQTPVQEPVCSRIQVSRPQPVPPTISPFVSLLRLVNRSYNPYFALFR
jgi:hypothetical protein